jgi:hypothetical protein
MSTPFDRRLLWVHWQGEVVRENSIEALADAIKRGSPNVSGVVVNTSTGAHWQGAFDGRRALAVDGPGDVQRWGHVLTERGLSLHVWAALRGEDILAESDVVIAACGVPGVQSMLLRVEVDTFPSAAGARQFISRVRAALAPEFHLGLNFDARGSQPGRIYLQEWLPYVQSLHPTVFYWDYSDGRQGPEEYLDDAFGTLVRYGLPIVPMLQTYPVPSPVPEEQAAHAAEYALNKGASGLTFFRLGGEGSGAAVMSALRRVDARRQINVQTPAQRVFLVRAAHLRARDMPGLHTQTVARIEAGTVVKVQANSRAEADGYIWWQAEQGWLAQGRIDRRQALMIDITPNVPPYDLTPPGEFVPYIEHTAPDVPQKRFRVATNSLSIRTQPELAHAFLRAATLRRGDEIVADADCWTEQDGFLWWGHGSGWSTEQALTSGLRLLDDLTPDVERIEHPPVEAPGSDAAAQSLGPQVIEALTASPTPAEPTVAIKRFRVLSPTLNVRSQPGLTQRAVSASLRAGMEIAVRADAWREVDGYVWWQHSTGWSAERTLTSSQRHMQDLTPEIPRVDPNAPPAPAPTPILIPIPAPDPDGRHRYRVVALGVTIRDEPNTNAIRVGRLRQGEELLIDPASVVTNDGYTWIRHDSGWSAVRSLDGKEELMLNIDLLPLLGRLVQRMPVRLEETDWVQYYGSTSFAYRYGRLYSYHTYAQGLHSGIDLGKFISSPANPPVFASVEGLFDGRGLKYGPNRVDVLVGDYRIIYGHIGRPANLPRRAPVGPDAVMGVVENSQRHLHFEIRYRDRYVLNPLLMMPAALAAEFISRFPPSDTTFVKTGTWTRWLTPFDQPVIRLGGEVIGPTA